MTQVFTGDALLKHHAITLKAALKLYAKTGLIPTRGATITKMLVSASNITGKVYKRGSAAQAAQDIEDHLRGPNLTEKPYHQVPLKYTITPGIAALVSVECDAFPERFGHHQTTFIMMRPETPPEAGIGDTVKWCQLPTSVQLTIEEHFHKVFALPLAERGEYLKGVKPWTIETL